MNPERRNECATVKNGNLGKRAVAATTSITGMNEKIADENGVYCIDGRRRFLGVNVGIHWGTVQSI